MIEGGQEIEDRQMIDVPAIFSHSVNHLVAHITYCNKPIGGEYTRPCSSHLYHCNVPFCRYVMFLWTLEICCKP